jgi:hypothetical protein
VISGFEDSRSSTKHLSRPQRRLSLIRAPKSKPEPPIQKIL